MEKARRRISILAVARREQWIVGHSLTLVATVLLEPAPVYSCRYPYTHHRLQSTARPERKII